MKSTKYYQLTKLFSNQRKSKFVLLVICTVSVSLNLLFAYQIQDLVDSIVSGNSHEGIFNIFLKICAIGLGAFLVSIIQTREWHIFRYKVVNQMRTLMFEKIMQKEASFFDGRTTGDVVSAILSDGAVIAESAGINTLMLFLNVYQIVIIISVLLSKNLLLGVIEAIVGLLYFLSINFINKQMRSNYKSFSKETANLNQMLVEDIKAVYEIKALNEKKYFIEKFNFQLWKKYFSSAKKVISIDVLSFSANQFINLLFPMFILVLGSLFTYKGLVSVGVVILFFTYTQKMVEPLNNLSDFYRGTQVAVGAADRIYDYLFEGNEVKNQVSENRNITQIVEVNPIIQLSINIDTFCWRDHEVLLKNIYENYKGGDIVFIQGESGSGKTTLLKLICGLYSTSEVSVKVNDCSINDFSEEQIFEVIKIQFQEPIIIEGTIRENIELGSSFQETDITEALRLACLYDFVCEVGLEYRIAENGKNLSGGQKQRLALARTILRKPKILILDEATSGLDEGNENHVIENLKNYVDVNKCILIVTSHKKGFLSICNKVLRL